MGWRGALRSASAAARRAEREQQREANRISRIHAKADKIIGKLSSDAERVRAKVERFEERIYSDPVKTLALRCDAAGNWTCQGLSDRVGDIQFSLAPGFSTDPLTFQPNVVHFERRRFTPVACVISPYATFVAFSVSRSEEASGSSSRKLINKTTPENSSIALVAHGQVYYAFDGTVDSKNIQGTSTIRVIAFEPFQPLTIPTNEFSVAFIPKATKKEPDPDAKLMKAAGPTLAREIKNLPSAPSLVDQFEKMISVEVQKATHEIRSSLPVHSSGGCLILLTGLAITSILTGTLIFGAM